MTNPFQFSKYLHLKFEFGQRLYLVFGIGAALAPGICTYSPFTVSAATSCSSSSSISRNFACKKVDPCVPKVLSCCMFHSCAWILMTALLCVASTKAAAAAAASTAAAVGLRVSRADYACSSWHSQKRTGGRLVLAL
jgi:hypothetical protein